MRRTQIYIEEQLDRELRLLATMEGRSAAALIREAIRRYLTERAETVDPIIAAFGTIDGLPPDAATELDRDLYGAPSQKSRR